MYHLRDGVRAALVLSLCCGIGAAAEAEKPSPQAEYRAGWLTYISQKNEAGARYVTAQERAEAGGLAHGGSAHRPGLLDVKGGRNFRPPEQNYSATGARGARAKGGAPVDFSPPGGIVAAR